MTRQMHSRKTDYSFALFMLFMPIAFVAKLKNRPKTAQSIEKRLIIEEHGYAYYLRHKTWNKIKSKRENESDEMWERRLKIYGFTKNGLDIKTGEHHGEINEILSEEKKMKSITWSEILNSFEMAPRDVSTAPIRNSAGKWFYVYVKDCKVCIESGREHDNSSNIKTVRILNPDELEDMLVLYERRRNGESVTYEAVERTVNQVYWYGIFRELGV